MPLPIFFIGAAAVTGIAGIGKTIKAGMDNSEAKEINERSNDKIEAASHRLEKAREECGKALNNLGEIKVFILNHNIKNFLDSFEKLKNVEFSNSIGIDELSKICIDRNTFGDLRKLESFASSLAGGTATGVAGGALTAFGAYSAATSFASASTGTAIASLSGVAAKNATLAFFGGGSLAAGGWGIAGGTAVLGGLVAAPALLAMGIVTGAKASKNLDNAYANAAKADEIEAQLDTGTAQSRAIRRRVYMFYNLLSRLDAYFLPLVYQLRAVVENEGTDYEKLSDEGKKIVVSAASIAVTIKTVLDTAILTEEGELTEESESVAGNTLNKLDEA